MKNPKWTKDELILALDLYLKLGGTPGSPKHPEVRDLSELLRRLPIHRAQERNENFRNPNSVYMKLGNLSAHDPDYLGSGLKRGSNLDQWVWQEFGQDRERLKSLADGIRKVGLRNGEAKSFDLELDQDIFPEGRLLTLTHRRHERNRKAVEKKKAHVLRVNGRLRCEACDFDFAERYGKLGVGFAECHHLRPLHLLTGATTVRLEDLAILCANCHRIIHRVSPMMSVVELRRVVEELSSSASRESSLG